MKVCLSVTIERDLFRRIEHLRGREKRSTFVEHLLKLGIERYQETGRRKPGGQRRTWEGEP